MTIHIMKKFFVHFRTLGFLGLALCVLTMKVAALEWNGTPYIGGDLQLRHMAFRQPYSTGIDKNHYQQGNVYLGVNCNSFFGLEFGLEKSSKKSENPDLPFGSPYMNIDVSARQGVIIKTNTTLRGYHGSLVGFLPIHSAFDLKLVGLLGIARVHTSIILKDCTNNGLGNWSRPFAFNKTIWTPRLGVGAQAMINHHLGLRTLVIWEKTSKFGSMMESDNQELILAPKNSFTPSIGLFYKF